MNFQTRANLSEWMDEPCGYDDFHDCLRDLATVNRLTFAYRPTLQWLEGLLRPGGSTTHIVDVGSGGGDMLRRIERWARERHIPVQLTGVDLNPYAARAAREFTRHQSSIHWVTGDAFTSSYNGPVDIVLSSLFTHHLSDDEIIRFLRWMEGESTRGWFINDLHRERFPYYAFRALATAMRWHRFVRHDGPVSIRRAFRPADWETYIAAAGLSTGAAELIQFCPARLCVSRVKS